MHSDDSTLAALNANLERLAAALERSETRFRILERRQRTMLFGLLLLGTGALLGGATLYSADRAVAQTPPAVTTTAPAESASSSDLHWVDQILTAPTTAKASRLQGQGGDDVAGQAPSTGRTRANWRQLEANIMAKAYDDLHASRRDLEANPLAGITLFLGEVQEALRSMSGMKIDMDSMRQDMIGMNQKMSAMLSMADDMGSMQKDMTEMNQKMTAITAMAAEMHAMNGTMGVMASGIDSTLGRTGRSIPFWMPW